MMNKQDASSTFKKSGRSIITCTIGHVDHGKSTLTAALTFVSSLKYGGQSKTVEEICRSKEEVVRGITILSSSLWYQTGKRKYLHSDCPGHVDYIKNMIAGSSQVDVPILVVALTDGPMPQTREHLLLISRMNIKNLVIFFNKVDDPKLDKDFIDLIIDDTLSLAATFGYKDVPYVVGSALLAVSGDQSQYGIPAIEKLFEIVDQQECKERDLTGPFLCQIDDVIAISGRGQVVTGIIIRGTIKPGDEVEIHGGKISEPIKTIVQEIQMFRTAIEAGEAGDNVGILLKNIDKALVSRGCIICKPNSIKTAKRFQAHIYAITKEEGGRSKPFSSTYKPQFFILADDITGSIEFVDKDRDFIMPGDQAEIIITLLRKTYIEPSIGFIIRESDKTIGIGKIIKIIE